MASNWTQPTRFVPDAKVPAWCGLIAAALRGEISLTDDDLVLIAQRQVGLTAAKQIIVGLKTAGLVSTDQADLAFSLLPLSEV